VTTAHAIPAQPKGNAWHGQSAEEVLAQLGSSATGLTAAEAALRLAANVFRTLFGTLRLDGMRLHHCDCDPQAARRDL
jgi:hypothetical protein